MTQARNTMATTTGSLGEPDESALPPLGTRAGTGAGAAVGQSRIHESARAQVAGAARYIDDLPELLADPRFPAGVRRILFDPHATQDASAGVVSDRSWAEIADLVRRGGVGA